IEKQISNLEKSNEECQQEMLESENDILKQERIKSLTAFINMEAFDPRAKIPDRIIDGFVERIIYDKGEFIWYLNPKVGNAIFEVDTTDWKKKMFKANKMVYPSLSGTGSYR
ncbi:resolvase, partial [Anaerovibrio lipolyticus]